MLKKILNIIRFFFKTKFVFGFPKKNKILLFDEIHSSILKQLIKKDFNILQVRYKKIYIWIFIKQIIYFDFQFKTYCKNYIKFTSPKVVVSFNDSRLEFYKLKKNFTNIKFITIMNGIRVNSWYEKRKKLWPKNLNCDYFFVLNKYYIAKYKKIINANYYAHGHFRNNFISIGKKASNKEFLLISQTTQSIKFEKLLNFINLYLKSQDKKLYILLRRSKDHPLQSEEIKFYKKIFNSNCIFYESSNWKKKYEILDKFENIIFTWSTMGFESIPRKKKIAVFSPNKIDNFKFYFGWPGPDKKEYSFFSAKKITYSEVSRVLNNIKNCSQINWNKYYYELIKDIFYFDKNNATLKKTILKLLN